MSEEKPKIVKAVNNRRKKEEPSQQFEQASLESQARLAEILSDSPRIASLAGTEWEIRALRYGTQWLMADCICKMNKKASANFGDIMKDFQTDIPSVVHTLTLALLNDRNKIFRDGNESGGYSDLYHATYSTLLWDCNVGEFAGLLLDVLGLLDINFTMDAAATLQMLTASVTAKKRMMTKGQKSSTQSPR